MQNIASDRTYLSKTTESIVSHVEICTIEIIETRSRMISCAKISSNEAALDAVSGAYSRKEIKLDDSDIDDVSFNIV